MGVVADWGRRERVISDDVAFGAGFAALGRLAAGISAVG